MKRDNGVDLDYYKENFISRRVAHRIRQREYQL
ncbi:hypothetical protein CMO94_01870 [Candidatus Woesearchaeota archaeon]|nr:hypothetical protein [Candidatus Woesearchaeota archaeon]